MHSPRLPVDGTEETQEPPLDDLLLAVSRLLRRQWAHGLAPWGLSPHQGRALRVVTADGSLRLGDLAEALRIAPRSATEVVDGLVELGLLVRTADPHDRRATRVVATDEGRRVAAEVLSARTARADEVFSVLSPVERSLLARLLRTLADARPVADVSPPPS
ncbi:MAG: MarR family winged helix-turn-helix transcriptional regulator [Actinomycetota bacterium]|nr:MarR family winged helix-turn-helix transcriptional regulator [Actinomycetota bacterium]